MNPQTRYVIGDIHGNYKALLQCIEKSGFNLKEDQLIILGDIVDGYPQSKECIDLLASLPNSILIIGNHDQLYMDWLQTGAQPFLWTKQGGQATLESVDFTFNETHKKFFNTGKYVYVDDKSYVYVHGGINLFEDFDNQVKEELMWDREMMKYAYNCERTKSCDIPKKLQGHAKYFIGHTTTENFGSLEPLKLCNVWCLDTGGGYNGRVTIMNPDTEEYWQSDNGDLLYGANQGRG